MKTSTSSNFLRQLLAPLCAAILPALLAASANAQVTIAGWDFSGYTGGGASPQSPTTNNANVSVTGLTRGSALGTSGSPAGNAWGTSVSVTNLSSATAAVASNSFATFAVKANSGFTLSLSNIAAYNVRRSGTGPTTGQWQYSTNGTAFTDIGTPITWGTTTTSSGNAQTAINLSGISALQSLPSSVTVTFRVVVWGATGTSGSWYLNNFQTNSDFILTGAVVASGPTLNTTGTLAPFSTTAGTASAAQTFNATGAALTADITVTAPTDFEVSTDGTTFGDTATITQSGGSASGTISARIKSTATVGAKSGNIVLSSTGATDVNVPVSGTVTAAGTPLVNLSTSSISNLSTSVGVASAVTNYLVTGTNLGTTAVTITPSEAFLEIGTNGSTFASTIDLSPTDGAVSNTVFLRVAATNVVTNYNATISHVSGSASNPLAVSGAITNLPPVLLVSTNTLSGFTTTTNVASTAQTFTVTGSNLTTNVTVGAPTGFEVANDGTTWSTNTSLTPISGSVSNTISVRLVASSVSGFFSGNVTVASTGATTRNVAASGVVSAPTVFITLSNTNTGSYTQNFDSLGTGTISNSISATAGVQTSLGGAVTNALDGWYAAKIAGTGTSATGIVADNGTNSSGGIYNYGSTANSDRSLGALSSGSTIPGFGALIKNETGQTLEGVQISFTAKFWRSTTNNNTLTFGYGLVDGSNFTTTNFLTASNASALTAADVVYPAGTNNAALDGNLPANQIALNNLTITQAVAPGATLFIRWQDANDAGNDAGLAIDNVSLTALGSAAAPIPPTITSTNAFSGTVGVAFSNDVTATGDAPIGFSGTALPDGLSVASSGAITGTPTAAGTFNATLTATNAAGTTNQAVTFTIAKGAVSITTPPTASGLVQGQALLDSFLSGGVASVPGTFAWADSSIIPPLGTTSYGVTFTPTDAANYDTAATNASVTVLSAYQAGYSNWLTEFQLDPQVMTGPNAGAPNADPDGDGFSNASEYAFGTNPKVPNGALLTTTSSNSVFRSSWIGPASGVSYGVQFSTNLSTMAFSNDPTITIESVGGVMSFTNQATGNKFFRVRATSN